jgi:hypothetical protein
MQTDLNGRVDPTDVLDQILTRWDDEDYDTELDNLDSVIDDNAAWLEDMAHAGSEIQMSDAKQIAHSLRSAVAALRNADQQRRDNARASS